MYSEVVEGEEVQRPEIFSLTSPMSTVSCEAVMVQDLIGHVCEGSSVDTTLGCCYPQAGFTS